MWTDTDRTAVTQKLIVVCEITGSTFSDPAKKLILQSLATRPAGEVLEALDRCAQECRGHLTLADIVERADEEREHRSLTASIEKTQAHLRELEEHRKQVDEQRRRGFRPPRLGQLAAVAEPKE